LIRAHTIGADETSRGVRETGRLHRLLHSPHVLPLSIVTACVVVANAPTLLHFVTTNPVQLYGNLQTAAARQALPGAPIIDPNAGFVTQSLGHVVASDWLHGHVPWWNPYEGIGSPLAGEMQAAAFFPPTLLLYGAWGFVWFHVLLELMAGWATYFLLRRLGAGRAPSTAAGVAFGLTGTFVWFSHAPANPVAFLPLALVALERCVHAARTGSRGGWPWLALALALSVLAGFPEVAYIDGLLVATWAAVRILGAGPDKRRLLGKVVGGAVVGGLLAAPVLVAFVTFLPHADIGAHGGAFGSASLVSQAIPQVLLPYAYGPIFAFHSTQSPDVFALIWDNVGGYLDATIVVCALVGVVGRRLRPLRLALVVWMVLGMGRTYGIEPIARLVTHFPGLREAATYRYSQTSWELAAIVLAALGIDDVARRRVRPRTLVAAGSITLVLTWWAAATAWPILTQSTGAAHRHIYDLASGLWATLGIGTVVVGGVVALGGERAPRKRFGVSPRTGVVLVAAAVALDAVAMALVPQFSAPTAEPLDLAVVHFLQENLGTARFATLGPIQPNFGSYFDIAEVNVNDLPVPSTYATYVQHHLDTNTNPLLFTGGVVSDATGPSPGQELSAHLSSYENLGVKYVVAAASGLDSLGRPWPPPHQDPPVRLVYHDTLTRVYQLPSPAPLFSAAGARCTIETQGWDDATVRCPRPAQLVRRVLTFPGWGATVGGRATSVHRADGLFQSISLPAGTSRVQFTFAPPYSDWASVGALVGAVLIIAIPMAARRRRRSNAGPRATDGDDRSVAMPEMPPIQTSVGERT
jgi:hypothetical protein